MNRLSLLLNLIEGDLHGSMQQFLTLMIMVTSPLKIKYVIGDIFSGAVRGGQSHIHESLSLAYSMCQVSKLI